MTDKEEIRRLQRDIREGFQRAGKDLKWLARQCQAADEEFCDAVDGESCEKVRRRYYERFKKDFQRDGNRTGRRERLAGYLRILSETREFQAKASRLTSQHLLPRTIEIGMKQISRRLDERIMLNSDADE